MRVNNEEFLYDMLNGKSLDFFLEDDMFEIEGTAKKENGELIIEVLDAVEHVLNISGEFLKLNVKNRKLFAERIDTGKIFEMEINRIYHELKEPSADEFLNLNEAGVEQFFQKETDTLVWFDDELKKWTIELNKINMYFSGDRSYFSTLDELFDSNKEQLCGIWQAVYFSSEVESATVY